MRFRAKIGPEIWVLIAMLCFFTVLWVIKPASDFFRYSILFSGLFALQQILKRIFTYWEVDSDCFRERRFLKVREIPWHTVTRVGRFQFAGYLSIFFVNQDENSGFITVNPADREQLLAALRQYAPQAKFDA
jgi:hypothetical protein